MMANTGDGARTDHAVEQLPSDFSVSQIAALLAFVIVYFLCAYSAALRLRYYLDGSGKHGNVDEHSSDDHTPLVGRGGATTLPTRAVCSDSSGDHSDGLASSQPMMSLLESPLTNVLSLNHAALVQHQGTVNAMAEFSTWMIWFYVSDRTRILPVEVKSYSRDVFLTVFAAVIAIGFGSFRKDKRVVTLSRQQSEEWKGWMQVMFLLYHYFEAREAYNAIRVLIAGYVWMTGYGNFHYYYRTNDFCIGRFAQMMWRLNFLVVACCVVLRNDYMLYYICPMHTIFTVLVYAALGIANHVNRSRIGMGMKLLACVLVVMIVWDFPGVFYALWKPFAFLVAYTDPRNPNPDSLHEWFFRSGLDRYVWIWGMLAAWIHPHIETAWAKIDGFGVSARNLCRAAVLSCCVVLFHVWYTNVYALEKLEYNRVHPYTSWVPISLWITVRNLTPQLREYSLAFLGWLGCITLETYISQFHIWLRSLIPNGQPKYLLQLVPGYPLLNFLVASILYIGVSYRLFTLTNTLKLSFVPHDDNRVLVRNMTLMTLCATALYLVAVVVHSFVYQSF